MAKLEPIPLALDYEDYLGFPDDGHRHEILRGEHVMTPAPSSVHQALVGRLLFAWMSYGESLRSLGSFWTSPIDVILSKNDILQPDLCFVAADGAATVAERGIEGPPAIVVEILSPVTRQRDETTKRHIYAMHGVREYWIIDPVERSVRILIGSESGYRQEDERVFPASGSVRSELLPGFELSLDRLFGDPTQTRPT